MNRIRCLLKMFLNAHSGFCRDEIQDYLNLYSFVINSPSDHLEKAEKINNLVFENQKTLKYREQLAKIHEFYDPCSSRSFLYSSTSTVLSLIIVSALSSIIIYLLEYYFFNIIFSTCFFYFVKNQIPMTISRHLPTINNSHTIHCSWIIK